MPKNINYVEAFEFWSQDAIKRGSKIISKEDHLVNILRHFLHFLTPEDINSLNEHMYYYFGRIKTREGIEKKAADFCKSFRQTDVFTGKDSGHKDMIFYNCINTSEFFWFFIFDTNNRTAEF